MMGKWTVADDASKITWISQEDFSEMDGFKLYSAAFYFTVATITTVGYGDILASTTVERIFAALFMIIGVILFSLATGSLGSILG